MSHNYICDCCGVSLDDFRDEAILHTKYLGKEKDYCPYCSKEIDTKLSVVVKWIKEGLRPIGSNPNALNKIDECNSYNDNYRKGY